MKEVSIASWNTSNVFSGGNSQIVEAFISKVKPDIFFGSEAFLEHDAETAGERIKELAQNLGYLSLVSCYDYNYHRPNNHGFMFAVREDMSENVDAQFVRAGTMNALRADIKLGSHDSITALGVHLDDRSNSPSEQLEPLLKSQINRENPTVIFGDMNDAHREDFASKVLRSKSFALAAKLGAKAVPSKMATEGRLLDIHTRLSMMAEGVRTSYLERLGFRDADDRHSPTIPVQCPIIQLDRFMTNGLAESSDFRRHIDATTQGKFSPSELEHAGISANFTITD